MKVDQCDMHGRIVIPRHKGQKSYKIYTQFCGIKGCGGAGCEDKSNDVFREILKCFRKTAKFEFFAKQIIYLEPPDHPLQNDI